MTDPQREHAEQLVRRILVDQHCMIGSNPDAPLEKICYCGWRGIGLLQHSQHAADERTKEGADLLLEFAREAWKDARFVASTTKFRAHSKDDIEFNSGCVQTRQRILDDLDKHIAQLQPQPAKKGTGT